MYQCLYIYFINKLISLQDFFLLFFHLDLCIFHSLLSAAQEYLVLSCYIFLMSKRTFLQESLSIITLIFYIKKTLVKKRKIRLLSEQICIHRNKHCVFHNYDAFIVHPPGPTRVNRSLSLRNISKESSGDEDLTRSDMV